MGAALPLAYSACVVTRLSAPKWPKALWVADRADHQVLAVDADGIVTHRISVPAPVAVSGTPTGGVRVLSGSDVRARYPRRVFTWDGSAPSLEESMPPPPGAWPRDWDVRLDERHRSQATDPLAAALGFDLYCSVPLPAHRGRWVVGGRGQCEFARLDRRDRTLFRGRLLDVDRGEVAIPAARESGGGLWIGCGGALVRIDHRGRRLPGQGGFKHIVDLAPVVGAARA